MKILRNIAVRIIPAGALAFIIFAAIAYQRGVYDFTFIERPATTAATTPVITGDTTAVQPSQTDSTTDSQTPPETEPPIVTDPVAEFLNSLATTSSLVSSGYHVTDAEFSSDSLLTRLNPAVSLVKDYSLRTKFIEVPVRIPNETYSGYTTELTYAETPRKLVEIYMDYLLIDDGNLVTVLNREGNVLYVGFDSDYVKPAYTRDSDDIPQFKVTQTNAKGVTTVQYYMFDQTGSFVESDYDDAAEKRGLYVNYPTDFGKTDNTYYRYYNDGLYGYGGENGYMRTAYRYPEAYNYSEGVAAVVSEDGVLNYIQKWFYTQITGTKTYRNLSYRYVISNYRAPDTHGPESIGFFYFDHGLCRVRKQEIDYSYNDRILTDTDIVIRLDGSIFPVPSEYTVVSYSSGILLLEKDGRYGFMDYTGRWIAQPVYDYAEPFNEGLGVIGLNGDIGMIDTTGNFVLPMIFDSVSSASGGIIAAWDEANGWSLFNKVVLNG